MKTGCALRNFFLFSILSTCALPFRAQEPIREVVVWDSTDFVLRRTIAPKPGSSPLARYAIRQT